MLGGWDPFLGNGHGNSPFPSHKGWGKSPKSDDSSCPVPGEEVFRGSRMFPLRGSTGL